MIARCDNVIRTENENNCLYRHYARGIPICPNNLICSDARIRPIVADRSRIACIRPRWFHKSSFCVCFRNFDLRDARFAILYDFLGILPCVRHARTLSIKWNPINYSRQKNTRRQTRTHAQMSKNCDILSITIYAVYSSVENGNFQKARTNRTMIANISGISEIQSGQLLQTIT